MPPTDKKTDAQTIIDTLEASGTGQHRLDVLRAVAAKGGKPADLLSAALGRPDIFGTITLGKLQEAIAALPKPEPAKGPLLPGKAAEKAAEAPPAPVAPTKA